MATHDYVIDNSTGANVRADINNVLQAILTNNSSSSAPSTTAAYMWWADTTSGTLKIRNSSDNAWVELLQLDGTLTLEDGTNSAPALAFRDDLDTGIYSSAANTFNVATGGTERMELGTTTIFNEDGADVDFRIEGDTNANLFYVDAGNDRIGIGTSSPSSLLTVSGATPQIRSVDTDGTNDYSTFQNSSGQSVYNAVDNNTHGKHLFQTAGTERMRIDSSGRVLIGTTSSLQTYGSNLSLQVAGTGFSSSSILLRRDSNNSNPPAVVFGKSRGSAGGNTVVQDNDQVGALVFAAADGTDLTSVAGEIKVQIDGTPGSNDTPGRIVFGTTADGATAVTERMRIDSSGRLLVGQTSGSSPLCVSGTDPVIAELHHSDGGTNDQARISLGALSSNPPSQRGVSLIGENNGAGHDFVVACSPSHSGGPAEKIRVNSSGQLLVGTLGVGGGSGGVRFQNPDVGTSRFGTTITSGTKTLIQFISNSANNIVGSISVATSSTSFNTSSDYRLKENESLISDGITRLKQLKPYRFNWKTDSSTIVDGFFAHEVSSIVPESITGTKDAVAVQEDVDKGIADAIGEPIYQSIDQAKLVPLLVAAVQELITKVETLEAA